MTYSRLMVLDRLAAASTPPQRRGSGHPARRTHRRRCRLPGARSVGGRPARHRSPPPNHGHDAADTSPAHGWRRPHSACRSRQRVAMHCGGGLGRSGTLWPPVQRTRAERSAPSRTCARCAPARSRRSNRKPRSPPMPRPQAGSVQPGNTSSPVGSYCCNRFIASRSCDISQYSRLRARLTLPSGRCSGMVCHGL